jgi:hypothetical protein
MSEPTDRQDCTEAVVRVPLRPDREAAGFYRRALWRLREASLPFLVGGAFALERHAGIARDTKDLDIFVRPVDRDRVLAVLRSVGCHTEVTFSHWLGKAFHGDAFIDVIWSSGNGIARVDDQWFAHAAASRVLGVPVRLCPPEEMIWSKAFVMERERYDGHDVAHLFRGCAERIAWRRLLRRFGPHWRVLLAHLLLFGFVYPGERSRIPAWTVALLSRRAAGEAAPDGPDDRLCRGTLLSRAQYAADVTMWGYRDARRQPGGTMSDEEIARWTAAAGEPTT